MKTHKFARRPFYVDAVRVTQANMEEVAEWCNGKIQTQGEDEAPYISIKVYRPLNDRQTQAFVGDWVLLYGSTGFKVYTPKAFDKSFEKVKTLSKAQADTAGIRPPHEKKRKEPANPVLPKEAAARIQEASKPKDEAQQLIDEVLSEK